MIPLGILLQTSLKTVASLGLIRRAYLPGEVVLPILLMAGCSTTPLALYPPTAVPTRQIRLEIVRNAVLSPHLPPAANAPRGLRLLYDIAVPARPALAVTRSIVRSNPRLDRAEALLMATHAVAVARSEGLDPAFFAALLLQESAFDQHALSAAGAVGVAQFTLETAGDYGVNPYDWRDAIRGSAALLSGYFRGYSKRYPDPYAATLAAYNAGPDAVAHYHGAPPYRETREYIGIVYERWSRIVRDLHTAWALQLRG